MGVEKEFDHKEIENIVKQMTTDGREGSLGELHDRINYISHVRINPTKSMSQAVGYLYEEADSLSAHVTNGTNEANLQFVEEIYTGLVKKGILSSDSQRRFEMMTARISKRIEEGKVPEGYGICFAISPDNSQFLIMETPHRKD